MKGHSLLGVALAVGGASCALPFPDYELEQNETTTTTTTGGLGGAGPVGAVGAACETDDDCVDGHCLESNTGSGSVCCATECDVGEIACGRNGKCDAGGADCALEPAGTTCGDATCEADSLTAQQCQAGICAPGESISCGGGLACAVDDTCLLTCETPEDCANPGDASTGAVCVTGECTARPPGAQCDAKEQCASDICGVTGTGHCCKLQCSLDDGACGATDCDSEGDCLYPQEDTPCGVDPACASGNLSSVYCNGVGDCTFVSTQACAGHLGCASAMSCYASCGSNDATGDKLCPSGYWCDGATCHQASLDEDSACLRDGQCSSNDCTALGFCVGAGCDNDGDGFVRDHPLCVSPDVDRDCDDNDARAHPGQLDFFETPRSNGGYDFDCNGTEERKFETGCYCAGTALLVPEGAAGCGVTGNLRSCYQVIFFLPCQFADSADTATQTCR